MRFAFLIPFACAGCATSTPQPTGKEMISLDGADPVVDALKIDTARHTGDSK
jgi:hypothetical protein